MKRNAPLGLGAAMVLARGLAAQTPNADVLFGAGRIADARTAYESRLAAMPSDSVARCGWASLRCGRIG